MIFHSTQKPRMYDYMIDKNGKVIDKNGELIDDQITPHWISDRYGISGPIRNYIPPEQRRNRQPGPARGLFQFLPSTWADDLRESARKEAMKPKYTDQQLRDALTDATRRLGTLDIDSSTGDTDFGTEDYWNLNEVSELTAILEKLKIKN